MYSKYVCKKKTPEHNAKSMGGPNQATYFGQFQLPIAALGLKNSKSEKKPKYSNCDKTQKLNM